MSNPLLIASVHDKIHFLRKIGDGFLSSSSQFEIPDNPMRDVTVLPPRLLPNKLGLSSKEGQARLLHDLAAIELQAMELALRGVLEFDNSPMQFKDELLKLALSEAEHLELCLNSLESLGYKWGDWPIHNMLWNCVRKEDELLDRILLVHCYLEGSGLDAGDTLLRRLYGLTEGITFKTVRRIVKDEIDHVQFGLRWFDAICKESSLDPEYEFQQRLKKIEQQIPKRAEPLSFTLRNKSGFNDIQINEIIKLRQNKLIKSSERVLGTVLDSPHLSGII